MLTDQTLKEEAWGQSHRVTANADIVDLRLRSINAELLVPTPRLPLSLRQVRVEPKMTRLSDDHAVYHVTYHLQAISSADQRLVFTTEITMSIVFRFTGDTTFTDAELRAFAAIGVLDILHPYLREQIQSLSIRMGLPRLVLNVKSPGMTN
jgi:preprotein translocase subunit SecB